MKGRYEDTFCHDFDEEIDQDGMQFLITRGSLPSMAQLEASLDEVKSLFEGKLCHNLMKRSTKMA